MEATKKIKLVVDGKTRKINVERHKVLRSIATIVGKPSTYFTYFDSDDDEITCLTEEEISCAIFEENVTKFATVFTSEEIPASYERRQPRSLNELTDAECEATTLPGDIEVTQNGDCCTNKSSSNVSDNAGATTKSKNSSTENTVAEPKSQSRAVSSKSGKANSNLDKFLPQLRKEHAKIYGMDCAFSVTNDTEKEMVYCPVCMYAVSSIPECVKTHLRSSSTHRANVHAILGHDMPSDAEVDQVELSFAMAKRFVETAAKDELEVVEDETGSGLIKCLTCVPLVKINISGRGSCQQRVEQHIKSEGHMKSKQQKRITSMFASKISGTNASSS